MIRSGVEMFSTKASAMKAARDKRNMYSTEYRSQYDKDLREAKRNGSVSLANHPEFYVPSLDRLHTLPSEDSDRIRMKKSKTASSLRRQRASAGSSERLIPEAHKFRRSYGSWWNVPADLGKRMVQGATSLNPPQSSCSRCSHGSRYHVDTSSPGAPPVCLMNADASCGYRNTRASLLRSYHVPVSPPPAWKLTRFSRHIGTLVDSTRPHGYARGRPEAYQRGCTCHYNAL